MAFVYTNPNPIANITGDCVIRACSIATRRTWDDTYEAISKLGQSMGLMPDKGAVWGAYLRQRGFYREIIPNSCPDCYTVKRFAKDHPKGVYVLAIDGNPGHVVTVVNGDYLDIWDCGDEIPTYYYYKGDRV